MVVGEREAELKREQGIVVYERAELKRRADQLEAREAACRQSDEKHQDDVKQQVDYLVEIQTLTDNLEKQRRICEIL